MRRVIVWTPCTLNVAGKAPSERPDRRSEPWCHSDTDLLDCSSAESTHPFWLRLIALRDLHQSQLIMFFLTSNGIKTGQRNVANTAYTGTEPLLCSAHIMHPAPQAEGRRGVCIWAGLWLWSSLVALEWVHFILQSEAWISNTVQHFLTVNAFTFIIYALKLFD